MRRQPVHAIQNKTKNHTNHVLKHQAAFFEFRFVSWFPVLEVCQARNKKEEAFFVLYVVACECYHKFLTSARERNIDNWVNTFFYHYKKKEKKQQDKHVWLTENKHLNVEEYWDGWWWRAHYRLLRSKTHI